MNNQPQLLADYECLCGEGPLWHPDENAVYWSDIPRGRLLRFDLSTRTHGIVYEGDEIGGSTLQRDGSLLLFQSRGAIRSFHNGEVTTLLESIPDERETRFNDVFADPRGRVFCGTMPTKTRKGRLYRLDTDGTLHRVLEDIGCANGMGFTPDVKQMYFTDSGTRCIYLFDYDVETGHIENQRVFVETPEGEGVPDGMKVDAEGFVWSARWDGGAIFRYNPNGELVAKVEIPARKITSLGWGGENYETAFVTTAGGDQKSTDGELAGGLFAIDLGVRGVPENRSNITHVVAPS